MNPTHKLYWLIGGIAVLLVVASLVGRILRMRVKDEQAAEKFRHDWEAIYSQPHRAPMLEPWLEYQQTGTPQSNRTSVIPTAPATYF